MKSALKIMEGVRALLSGPDKWTKGAMAKNAEGFGTTFDDPQASCWCLVGALYRAAGVTYPYPMDTEAHMRHQRASQALKTVVGKDSENGLIIWNDMSGRGYETVIHYIDKAIEIAKAV